MCSLKPVLLYHVGTEEFFDPTVDASCMNTYTKRDHVFAKLNVQLQRGTVTLLHKEQSAAHASESAFMQLEFSGTAQSQLCPSQRQNPVCFHHLGQLVDEKVGAGEMPQTIRVCTTLAEGLCLIPRTHVMRAPTVLS